MRVLCKSMAGMVLAALLAACGSTGNSDEMTLSFQGFDGANIKQPDAIRPTSADIDVVQEPLCAAATGGTATAEPYGNASMNANFLNNEASDIHITQVRIDFGSSTGLGGNGIRVRDVNSVIPGGRCLNGTACAVDADCSTPGGIVGACKHTATSCGASPATGVCGLLLIDVDDKAHISPNIAGQGTNVSLTFFAHDDAAHSFEIDTSYVVTFADFDNCLTTGTGAGAS